MLSRNRILTVIDIILSNVVSSRYIVTEPFDPGLRNSYKILGPPINWWPQGTKLKTIKTTIFYHKTSMKFYNSCPRVGW